MRGRHTSDSELYGRTRRAWGRGTGCRWAPRRAQGTEHLQHHRWPPCRLMDESLPPGSWNRLVTRSVLAFHARTVPSALQEYTWLGVHTHVSSWPLTPLCTFHPEKREEAIGQSIPNVARE